MSPVSFYAVDTVDKRNKTKTVGVGDGWSTLEIGLKIVTVKNLKGTS